MVTSTSKVIVRISNILAFRKTQKFEHLYFEPHLGQKTKFHKVLSHKINICHPEFNQHKE